jgi:SPFH domain / Band 7 family
MEIYDPVAFLFRVQDPEGMIRMVAETAVRAVIGRNPIQSVLSDRRQQIAVEVQSELQRLLDDYGVGVMVIQVQLQRIDPPPGSSTPSTACNARGLTRFAPATRPKLIATTFCRMRGAKQIISSQMQRLIAPRRSTRRRASSIFAVGGLELA